MNHLISIFMFKFMIEHSQLFSGIRELNNFFYFFLPLILLLQVVREGPFLHGLPKMHKDKIESQVKGAFRNKLIHLFSFPFLLVLPSLLPVLPLPQVRWNPPIPEM